MGSARGGAPEVVLAAREAGTASAQSGVIGDMKESEEGKINREKKKLLDKR